MQADEAGRLARALLAEGRAADAQRICQQALKPEPQPAPRTAELWELTGRAEVTLGDLERGLASLRRAADLDAGRATAWAALAETQTALERPADAAATLAAALDHCPHDPPLQALLALRFAAEGQVDDALETANVALAADDTCANGHRAAVEAALRLGALDRAREHCRRVIELLPLDIGARRQLARVLDAQGQADAAIATLEVARTIEPAHPQVLDELGQHYNGAGRTEDAAACWDALATLYPDAPDAQRAAGHGLMVAGLHPAALPRLTRAARAPDVEPRVWLDMATCLEHERRPDQALAACERYLASRPDDEDARGLHERLSIRLEV